MQKTIKKLIGRRMRVSTNTGNYPITLTGAVKLLNRRLEIDTKEFGYVSRLWVF